MPRTLERKADGSWKVRESPRFVIFDELLGDYCALPRESKPLDWATPLEAREWLRACAVVWKSWEGTECAEDVPESWRGFQVPAMSPFTGYLTPITPTN